MRAFVLMLAVALSLQSQSAAADYPNKPAPIVFRDAKLVCPMVLKQMNRVGGRNAAIGVLQFAVERKYSKSDTKTLLRVCTLYAQSGRF